MARAKTTSMPISIIALPIRPPSCTPTASTTNFPRPAAKSVPASPTRMALPSALSDGGPGGGGGSYRDPVETVPSLINVVGGASSCSSALVSTDVFSGSVADKACVDGDSVEDSGPRPKDEPQSPAPRLVGQKVRAKVSSLCV